MTRLKSIIVVILLLVGYGLSVFLFFGNVRLKKELRLSEETIEEANSKKEGVYKKYREMNALTTQLTRVKSSLEGDIVKAGKEAERLEAEKADILADNELIEKTIREKEERIASFEDEVKDLEEGLATVRKQKNEAEEKSRSEIAELEKRLDKLLNEKNDVQLELQKTEGDLERSRTNNGELCAIAMEILESYENKGPLTSLLEKEPFVQTKRVELEKYSQEYMQKIEEHKETQ